MTTYPTDHPLMTLLRDVRTAIDAAGIRNATAGIHSRDLDSVAVSVTWSSGPDGRRTPDALEAAGFELTYHTPACRSAWVTRTTAQAPAVVDVDPIACRTRWHAGPCEVITYSDGTTEHMTHGEPSERHNVWTCTRPGCGGR